MVKTEEQDMNLWGKEQKELKEGRGRSGVDAALLYDISQRN